ncbi:hypothetical protein E4U53_005232 [Claviceps sorghi]|nr:hypothetical protein E4U53_005232 [Claviceps sorghi]
MALKYYKLAMERVVEVGLDPFSDEVLGIRIQVASWLEKINSYKASIDVLESVLQDCKKWVTAMEQSVSEGKVSETGRYKSNVAAPKTQAAPQSPSDAETAREPRADGERKSNVELETLWRKRQRLLAKAISTAVKLGELYADEHARVPSPANKHGCRPPNWAASWNPWAETTSGGRSSDWQYRCSSRLSGSARAPVIEPSS